MSTTAIFLLGVFVMVPVTAAFSILMWAFVQDERENRRDQAGSSDPKRPSVRVVQ